MGQSAENAPFLIFLKVGKMKTKLSARAIAARNWLIAQRRIAAERRFHFFTVREDRAMPVEKVVEWFEKFCPELNCHNDGQRVFLCMK